MTINTKEEREALVRIEDWRTKLALIQRNITPFWKRFGKGYNRFEAYVHNSRESDYVSFSVECGDYDTNHTKKVMVTLHEDQGRPLYELLKLKYDPDNLAILEEALHFLNFHEKEDAPHMLRLKEAIEKAKANKLVDSGHRFI
jgi:hypothetical protein